MPIVIDPPIAPPPSPPSEDGSFLWELPYEAMGFHRDDDEANDFALLNLCQALSGPLQPIYDLVRERSDRPGWSILFDPDECPVQRLPYLAQFVGVAPTPEMTEKQLRNEIREPTGWKRGQPEALRIATRRTLQPVADEELMVIIRPRTPGPGQHYIRTLLAQTPDPARTEVAVRANLAAWEMLDYAAIDGVTYADIAASYEDYAALAAAFPNYKALRELLPSELPEP